MTKAAWVLFCSAIIQFISGCAQMQFNYETPTVSLNSFRILPSEGMGPRFEIGLHVVNPNRSALALQGIAYTVIIEGHRILTGVANDLPVIDGYGEGDILLNATADLFNSINLITNMVKDRRESVAYELDAKLDVGGFRPNIHVEKRGELLFPRIGK
ncbi:MAG: LEA type 2 family protein [Pseudomonadota bacterium]